MEASLTPRSPIRPLRILQVLMKMDAGGLETWLLHVLGHLDRERFQVDLLVHQPEPGVYDAEARRLGAKVIYCPFSPWPWQYAKDFRRVLQEHGPYDVIHSHIALSGYILRLASQAGIPVRIAHTHADEAARIRQASLARRLFLNISQKWISTYATTGLATSPRAARSRFGPRWRDDSRWRVLFCGVDLSPFQARIDPGSVRRQLGIPADALVIGHVGSFKKVKNHEFLVEIGAELARLEPRVRLLLVGDGPLRPEIEMKVSEAGLGDKVIFAGIRRDVPRLLLGAMDVFLFPSHYESLGLALVEAQTAGLPCVLADTVPEDAEVIKTLTRRLSLAQPPSRWAEAIIAAGESRPALSQPEALAIIEETPFNILTCVAELEDIYSGTPGLHG